MIMADFEELIKQHVSFFDARAKFEGSKSLNLHDFLFLFIF